MIWGYGDGHCKVINVFWVIQLLFFGFTVLHERKSVSYNLANAFSWMLQLTEALEHLHDECSPPIVHGDVKPANCLLFDGGARLKLCDFGSADSIQPEGGQSPTRRGTGGFMAPEIFTRPRELVKSSG